MSNVLAHNFNRDDTSGALINTDIQSLQSYKNTRNDKIENKRRFDELEKNLAQVKIDINSIKGIVSDLCALRD